MLEDFALEQLVEPLLEWFEKNARTLPWRSEPTPYRVWVSEIMLQQTRVEAVKPYFARFMEALPNIQALAECEEEKLLKLWEGLGYYNRVRNMQIAAQTVVEEYDGQLACFKRNRSLYRRGDCFYCLWNSGAGGGWQCTSNPDACISRRFGYYETVGKDKSGAGITENNAAESGRKF